MSIRQNKSSTNLQFSLEKEEQNNELSEMNTTTTIYNLTNMADSQISTGTNKNNSSTVLDIGFDYWNSSRNKFSITGGGGTGNSRPYKPPISYRVGNSKILINRPLATAITVITFALFFLSYVAYKIE